MLLEVFFIAIGFAFLIKGADFLIDGASGIAKKFNIPEIIIGLTIVSIGTSTPELFISVSSILAGHEDFSIGNVLGSNITNLLLILGITAIITPIYFKSKTKLIELPMCLFFTVVFVILCNIGRQISTIDAVILLICFVFFIIYTIHIGQKNKEKDSERSEITNRKNFINIIYILIGIIGLKIGGDFVVNNAEKLALRFNISEKIISLTVIAIGTSLPELVTSVLSAIKKEADLAVGNVIGSNIFNMLLVIGTTSFIKPISYNVEYNVQMTILLIASILICLFPYLDKKDQMTKSDGLMYVSMYAIYMLMLFVS